MKNILSNKAYDILKVICITILPALGTLYFALAGIWGFPYGEQVVATCAALSTLIGAITEWQRYRYNKSKEGEQ